MWPHPHRTTRPRCHRTSPHSPPCEYILSNQHERGKRATLASRARRVMIGASMDLIDEISRAREETTGCGNGCPGAAAAKREGPRDVGNGGSSARMRRRACRARRVHGDGSGADRTRLRRGGGCSLGGESPRPEKKESNTRKTTELFDKYADGRNIVVNPGKSPTYGCPNMTPVNSMALRTQLPVLSQSLRWLGAQPAFGWVAVASATVLFRAAQCPRRALAPLSSEWLSDINRQKMQGRDF